MPANAPEPPAPSQTEYNPAEPRPFDTNRTGVVAVGLSLLVAGWIFAATAWICDDAFITFRSVEQLVDGNGPRWNPHERVQAFTHPLWFGAVASTRLLVGDPAVAAKVLSWFLAMAAFWLLARRVLETADRVLLLLALTLTSRAFVDYSSSGLEDPLSHLLLVMMALRLFRHADAPAVERLRRVAWPAGLLLLCRHDHLWLVAPPCLWLAWRAWREEGHDLRTVVRGAVPGFLPFLAWTVFAVVYYGFPFPNTAYAKLNTGIAGHELWGRGVDYLTHTASWDPVTVVVVLVGAYLWTRSGTRSGGVGPAVAFGMLLHLLYVVRIGGDFMAGRFLSEPFTVGLVALVLLAPRPTLRPALAVLAAFVVLWPLSPFKIDDAYGSYHPDDHHGIADERSFYSGRQSYRGFERRWPIALWRSQTGPREHFEVGFSAYSTGTHEIVVDRFALADPLLARLPAEDGWTRVGHFKRSVPTGYLESLRSKTNQIENPFVHHLYDDLMLVTQGPLFAPERWAAIWRLNVFYRRPGCVDPPCRKLVTHLLPPQLYRPLLPLVDREEGFVEVRPHPPAPSPTLGERGPGQFASLAIEGRMPFSLLEEDQLVRLFLPAHPTTHSLELAADQDPAGDLRGFRAVLTFDDPATAGQAATSLCVAVASEGGSWQLLPRLDSAGGVCSRLALTD